MKAQRIACLGDSLTALPNGYCKVLGDMLGVTTKAFGYEGQGVGVIGSHVDDVLAWNPDAVVVLAGVNDLRSPTGAAHVIAGLTGIYAQLHAHDVEVVAVEILPWHGYSDAKGWETNTVKVNNWIRKEANVEAVVKTSSLGDYRGQMKKEYMSDNHDGLHMNREGQSQLAVLIADQAFGG
jgi:lysophospholipase L1-like esterase